MTDTPDRVWMQWSGMCFAEFIDFPMHGEEMRVVPKTVENARILAEFFRQAAEALDKAKP